MPNYSYQFKRIRRVLTAGNRAANFSHFETVFFSFPGLFPLRPGIFPASGVFFPFPSKLFTLREKVLFSSSENFFWVLRGNFPAPKSILLFPLFFLLPIGIFPAARRYFPASAQNFSRSEKQNTRKQGRKTASKQ